MAAKKKAKAKKKAPAKKTKKTKAKKSARKPVAKKAKKAAKKSKKVVKAAARKAPAKKAKKVAKKKQAVGEGDYAASKAFLKDQSSFVAKNKAKIPDMGKAAEKALDGPEGASLRDAEAEAAGHSRDTFGA